MRLLCDVDELLLDLQQPIAEAIYETTGVRFIHDVSAQEMLAQLSFEDVTRVTRRLEEPRFVLRVSVHPIAFEVLDAMRNHVEVRALLSPIPFVSPHWLLERVQWVMRVAGFSLDDITVTTRKAHEAGDIMIARRGASLRAWKKHHPQGTALLWHDPAANDPDEPIWTRVWDWRVIEWFARSGARRIAACS